MVDATMDEGMDGMTLRPLRRLGEVELAGAVVAADKRMMLCM